MSNREIIQVIVTTPSLFKINWFIKQNTSNLKSWLGQENPNEFTKTDQEWISEITKNKDKINCAVKKQKS